MYNELVWLLSGNLKSRDEGDGSMTSCRCTLGVPVTCL